MNFNIKSEFMVEIFRFIHLLALLPFLLQKFDDNKKKLKNKNQIFMKCKENLSENEKIKENSFTSL